MIRCPICQKSLSPAVSHPYAPICSEPCRQEALRRLPAGQGGAGSADHTQAADGPVDQFEKFTATHLYCSVCRRSSPTREKLLLTLPDGDLYGYSCAQCGSDVGTRKESNR